MKGKRLCLVGILLAAVLSGRAQQTKFRPGQPWNDTGGKAINAHAGCVVKDGDYYYWIGDRRGKNDCLGVGCYRSADLLNWTDLGYAVRLQGAARDDCQDFAAGRALYRPKIARCAATGKWVMCVVWENDNVGDIGRVAFATSDTPAGPYALEAVTNTYTSRTRDQSVFQDDDGRLYYQAAVNGNQDVWNCLMTDDYLGMTGTSALILPKSKYEAPALFRVDDLYFGLFSGCTGWNPNRSRYAWGRSLTETWHYEKRFTDKTGSGEEFCVDDTLGNTYQSQSAYVLKVDGDSRRLIYVGDRWNASNLESSRLVWLPISMRSGKPAVRWYDEWDMSVFDEMYRFKRALRIEDGDEVLLLERNSNRFLSRPGSRFVLDNDSEDSNLRFRICATDVPHVYRLQEQKTGKYLSAVFGSLRLNAEDGSDAQCWTFLLQPDGTYRIEGVGEGLCLTVSGASPFAGTGVYLAKPQPSQLQSFGVYFDSRRYPEKEEARIFTLAYLDSVAAACRQQEEAASVLGAAGHGGQTVACSVARGVLRVRSSFAADAQVSVFAADGSRRFAGVVALPAGGESQVPCRLSPGVYLVRIVAGGTTFVRKVAGRDA